MSLISGNEEKIFKKGDIGNVRKAQEDSHGLQLGTPNGDLFVVCDGMGGHFGRAKASNIAVNSIIDYIKKERYESPKDALNGALQFANMQILHFAETNPQYKGMGTTACVVLIGNSGVWIAHVGDSRIYLYLGKERQLHRLTKDHSYVQTLVDSGEIPAEAAEHHPNKNSITKAIGIKPELQPSFNYQDREIIPKNRDIFLLCSDGLCGMIPDSTIERVLGEKMTLKEKGEELIRLAMEGETVIPGGQDNCTIELIEIDNGYSNESVFKSFNPVQTIHHKKNTIAGSITRKHWAYLLVGVLALIVVGVCVWWFSIGRDEHLLRKLEKDRNEKKERLESSRQERAKLYSVPPDRLTDSVKMKCENDSIAYMRVDSQYRVLEQKINNKKRKK